MAKRINEEIKIHYNCIIIIIIMSNNSWKQYGGMSKIDKFQHLTIGTLVADQVLLREKVSTVSIFKTSIIVQGSLTAYGDISGVNFICKNNLSVDNISYLKGKLYLGVNNYFLNSVNNGIGINNDNPLATLDIYGNLIVRSGTTYIRNIIAQNNNNKGIAVSVDNNNSYIDFFNTTTTSTNLPNSRISTYDNTFQLDTTNNIINTTTSKINSLSSIDICSNIIGNIKAGSTLNLLSNSKININANTFLDIASANSTIYSRLHITNRDVSSNIFDETVVIYDISSGKYLYDIYENNNTTGHSLTLVSNNNSSNTFMKIVSPNKCGLGIGGGTYSNDNNMSMGIIGLNKSDGTFIPIQNIVSGTTKVKYYATVGINKHSPITEKYIMDINGSTRITNGEINKIQDIGFQILNISFSKINKLFGIAVGTPSSINSPYVQNIYYTNDGGLNWILSEINKDPTGLAASVKNLVINVYNNDFSVIGANNTNLLYSTNGGVNWTRINITSFTFDTIKSIFITQTPGSQTNKRIFLAFDNSFGYFDNTNLDNIRLTTITGLNNISSINYVDGSSNYVFYVGNGIQRYNISNNIIDTNNNSIIYNHINVWNGSYSIAVGVNNISYTKDSGANWRNISINNATFNSVFIYDENRAIAVGNNGVIYYTNNGYSIWNVIPNLLLNSGGNANILNGSSVTLRSIYMNDINSFMISRNVQSYIVNPNNPQNNQLGLSKIYYCYFPNLFNRSQNNVVDVSGSIQIGGDLNINEGGNLYVDQDSRLNGNLYVMKDSILNSRLFTIGDTSLNGNLFVNYDVSMNSRLVVGSDTTINKRLFTLGDTSLNGNLFVNYDVSMNSRLVVGSDTTINKRLFTLGDTSLNGNLFVNYDVSMNSRLVVGSDTTINKRLFTLDDVNFSGSLYVSKDAMIIGNLNVTSRIINNSDVIMKSSLFVDYDASINRSVYIGKDLTVNGNLTVKQYQNQNIINTTVSNYNLIISEDLSLNGRLYTSNDVSFNGNLYLNKSMKINTTNNITNALVNINGNMITNYIGINTTNVNTNRALDINGNVFQSNGCIFQF